MEQLLVYDTFQHTVSIGQDNSVTAICIVKLQLLILNALLIAITLPKSIAAFKSLHRPNRLPLHSAKEMALVSGLASSA